MDLVENLIKEYLAEANILSLCTTSQNGMPWASTVYFVTDSSLNLIFISKLSRRHSQEIKLNSAMAGTICKQHNKPFEMACRGLQLEGHVTAIEDADLSSAALSLYLKKFPHSKRLHEKVSDVTGTAERRAFLLKPDRIVLFDEETFSDCPQQEFLLNKL